MASTWLVVLGLAFWAAIAAALPDVPSVANFMRKATANAVVLGDFVYVDGGEMSQKVDGKVATFKDRDGSVIFSVQVNSTVSIDMSKSWTSDSVAMRTIKKQGPLKTNMQAWADRSANVFYSWGGKWIRGFNMTETTLWKFAADGSGGGTWSVAPAANPSLLNTLHPGEFAAVAATSDSAFVMGGVASGWTEQFRAITQTLPGMATYNLSTRVWQNGTTNFSPFDRIAGASAEFVPSFGPNGLIFAFGGFAPPADDPNPDFGTSPNFDLQNLTFFDPQTKKTYSQVTTGDVPPYPRSEFCTAGFSDPSGRHEIFMFGGTNRRDKFAYNDSYVLSLPGFVWTKLPDSPDGVRTTQACVVVGNRQVLSIGGVDGFGKGYNDVDPAPQGLLLFDMVDQKWSHSYNASAPAYESPKAIQDLYSAGVLSKVQWSSDDVKKLFATSTSNSTSPPPTSSPEATSSGSSTNVGAIAGGVVGGVAAIALVGLAAWLIMRRRRRRELGAAAIERPYEAGGQQFSPESKIMLPQGGMQPHELQDIDHHELPLSTPQQYSEPVKEAQNGGHRRGGSELAGSAPPPRYYSGSGPPAELDGGYTR